MSVSKPWKALERRAAKLFGGERLWRPDFGQELPDGESGTHVWDAKYRQRHALIEVFVRCERKYRSFTGDRRFVLYLFSAEHPRAGDFVLVRAKDYRDLIDKACE